MPRRGPFHQLALTAPPGDEMGPIHINIFTGMKVALQYELQVISLKQVQ